MESYQTQTPRLASALPALSQRTCQHLTASAAALVSMDQATLGKQVLHRLTQNPLQAPLTQATLDCSVWISRVQSLDVYNLLQSALYVT